MQGQISTQLVEWDSRYLEDQLWSRRNQVVLGRHKPNIAIEAIIPLQEKCFVTHLKFFQSKPFSPNHLSVCLLYRHRGTIDIVQPRHLSNVQVDLLPTEKTTSLNQIYGFLRKKLQSLLNFFNAVIIDRSGGGMTHVREMYSSSHCDMCTGKIWMPGCITDGFTTYPILSGQRGSREQD